MFVAWTVDSSLSVQRIRCALAALNMSEVNRTEFGSQMEIRSTWLGATFLGFWDRSKLHFIIFYHTLSICLYIQEVDSGYFYTATFFAKVRLHRDGI